MTERVVDDGSMSWKSRYLFCFLAAWPCAFTQCQLLFGEHGCEISEHGVVDGGRLGGVVIIRMDSGRRIQFRAEDSSHQEWHGRLLFRILGGPTPVDQRGNGLRSQQLVSLNYQVALFFLFTLSILFLSDWVMVANRKWSKTPRSYLTALRMLLFSRFSCPSFPLSISRTAIKVDSHYHN